MPLSDWNGAALLGLSDIQEEPQQQPKQVVDDRRDEPGIVAQGPAEPDHERAERGCRGSRRAQRAGGLRPGPGPQRQDCQEERGRRFSQEPEGSSDRAACRAIFRRSVLSSIEANLACNPSTNLM